MHLHADHSLVFKHRQSLWRTAGSLGLTACVLVANVGVGSTAVSLTGAGIGFVLLVFAHFRGHRRVESAVAWTLLLVAAAVVGSALLSGDRGQFVQAVARISCGMMWTLWLGTQVDWTSVRQLLLAVRVPKDLVAVLDHALMHGVFTQREWARRRDAARLRLGTSRLPIGAWGPLIGEGALHAFLRVERMEDNSALRSQSSVQATVGKAVHLNAVQVERGGQTVLEDLDLQLEPGERLLVCGPSGAGKSSLLRLLAGLDGPARGTMTRFGTCVPVGEKLGSRLDGRVALLSQNPEEHFIASTVAEDVMWGMLRRGTEAEQARMRCEDVAKALGVGHLLERPCHALSFGEQRRVALAGLLVLEPSLLLLDEPTSGLDPVAAHELRALVEQSIERTGAACVWATHDLQSAPPRAERVLLLQAGRALFDGPATEGLSKEWLVRAGLALPDRGSDAC